MDARYHLLDDTQATDDPQGSPCAWCIIMTNEIRMIGRRREHLVEYCTFQNRNPVRVFLYHCISDGNQLFSENFGCNFYLILRTISDKAAFVSGALFCVQRYRGNLEISRSNSASRWKIINLHMLSQIV